MYLPTGNVTVRSQSSATATLTYKDCAHEAKLHDALLWPQLNKGLGVSVHHSQQQARR